MSAGLLATCRHVVHTLGSEFRRPVSAGIMGLIFPTNFINRPIGRLIAGPRRQAIQNITVYYKTALLSILACEFG